MPPSLHGGVSPLRGVVDHHGTVSNNREQNHVDEETMAVDSQQQKEKETSQPNPPPNDKNDNNNNNDPLAISNASWASQDGADRIGKAVQSFFYPERNQHPPTEAASREYDTEQQQQDWEWMDSFWKTYDDIIFLSLFSQLGILFRLAAAAWFHYFDDNVFSNDSPLFVNLPLNCLSCFIVGLLGDGESLLSIILTRMTPHSLLHNFQSSQQQIQQQQSVFQYPTTTDDDDEEDEEVKTEEMEYRFPNDDEEQQRSGRQRCRLRRPRHTAAEPPPGLQQQQQQQQKQQHGVNSPPPKDLDSELREVQLLALGRRIRASKCLILFSGRKQDIDVLEHYFDHGYRKKKEKNDDSIVVFDLSLQETTSNCSPPTTRRRADEQDGGAMMASSHTKQAITSPAGSQSSSNSLSLVTTPLQSSSPLQIGPLQQSNSSMGRRRSRRASLQSSSPTPESSLSQSNSPISPPITNNNNSNSSLTITGNNEDVLAAPTQLTRKFTKVNTETAVDKLTLDHSTPSSPPTTPTTLTPLNVSDDDDTNSIQATSPPPPLDTSILPDANDSTETVLVDDSNTMRTLSNNVTEHFARFQRVRLTDGWDVKSSPEEMSDDLMLGLRDGFCGAVSSFSSWNSAMVALMRHGEVNKALVGYCLGLQLPIIFYRFGQHVAVYLFMWKCRQETRRDERRGYGIRVNQKDDSDEDDDDDDDDDDEESGDNHHSLPLPNEVSRKVVARRLRTISPLKKKKKSGGGKGRLIPSVRAIATALFIMALIAQFTSLSFFTKADQQLLALSLLFSPLGTLARWRLGKLNTWKRRFPLGTFSCNILACALSGSLGSILAGNPGPRERVFLVSVIAGFGGTLSSVAAFVVEVLGGIDPLLLKLDGLYYAVASVFWAAVVGFIFTTSQDWADVTTTKSD